MPRIFTMFSALVVIALAVANYQGYVLFAHQGEKAVKTANRTHK